MTKDTGTASDGSIPPFDAGAFCTGTSPKMIVNGADVPVMNASGKAIILNCCDSAELTLATAAYQALMYVMWRVPASTNGSVDLSNLPQGSSIEMDLGCDPSTTSCATASPEERYTDGFSGTIQWQYGGSGMTVSYCLQVTESPSQPHSVIHSMALYAPNVASP